MIAMFASCLGCRFKWLLYIARMPRAQWSLLIAVLALASTLTLAQTLPSLPPAPEQRVPATDMGIAQLPNEKLDWLLDAKLGMFIHWGLYSGPGKGEWLMEHKGISPEQ